MAVKIQPLNIDGVFELGLAKCQIDFDDLTDADLSQTFTFNDLAKRDGGRQMPANARVMYAWINVLSGFSGGSVSAITAQVGDAGDPDELIAAVSVLAAAEGLKPASGVYTLGTFESAYAPLVTIDSVGDNLDQVDAGRIEVFLVYQAIGSDSACR